jgi:hypothetical protein
MDEHYHVSILFDCTGFTKVTESRSMIFAIFGLSIELGEAKQWDAELSRDSFQASSDFSDLFLPWIA